MADLFSLNFCSPSYDTISRANKKGVHFVPRERNEIFKCVADIYSKAMIAHSISRPILVILSKDETKVKSRATWEPKYDTLARFCGPKDNHVCQSRFKLVVGIDEDGYNVIVDAFRNNKLSGFARIVVVNPLNESLPRLVLVVCTAYNCFDAS